MPKKTKYIAIIGPMGIAIPPKKQGGIEWMVYYLTEGLVKKGYRVLLLAPQGSKTSAKLIPVSQKPMSEYKVGAETEASRALRIELSMLAKAAAEIFKRRKEIGVVFNHSIDGGVLADLEQLTGIPVFHTLHLPLFKEVADVYEKFNARLIAISRAQKKAFPGLNYAETIYNGIDIKKFPFSKTPKDYFIFVGKIRPSKNPKDAILAAKKAGVKLILIGKKSDPKYFETEVKPLLNKNIKYLGEVPFQKVLALYKNAKALLFPVKWEEPFGLVMIESMACGAPVIAFDRGSVREVIKNGRTGFVVKNTSGMTKAMRNVSKIKREDCRLFVQENFSAEKMIEKYEKICKKHI